MKEKRNGWLDGLNLLAIKTLAAVGMFILASLVSIWLVAQNKPISDGVTIFASGLFAAILAAWGVQGWERIQQRKTEWEPSQPVKDQIQMARMMKPPTDPVVQPFVPVEEGSVESGAAGTVTAKPKATTGPAFGGHSQ